MIPAPFRYPFRGDRAVDVLVIGGGLHLLSVYLPVLPLVVVLGYLVRSLTELAGRDWTVRFDDCPRFRPVRTTVRRGLGAAVVLVAYLLPAAVVLLVTIHGLLGRPLSPESVTFGTSLGFVAGSTAALLLAMAFTYLLPAGLASYGARGRIRAAFDGAVLRSAATDAGYFYNVLVGLVIGSLLLTVAGALVDVAAGFFLAFYGEVVAVGFWARGVDGVVDVPESRPETAVAEAAD